MTSRAFPFPTRLDTPRRTRTHRSASLLTAVDLPEAEEEAKPTARSPGDILYPPTGEGWPPAPAPAPRPDADETPRATGRSETRRPTPGPESARPTRGTARGLPRQGAASGLPPLPASQAAGWRLPPAALPATGTPDVANAPVPGARSTRRTPPAPPRHALPNAAPTIRGEGNIGAKQPPQTAPHSDPHNGTGPARTPGAILYPTMAGQPRPAPAGLGEGSVEAGRGADKDTTREEPGRAADTPMRDGNTLLTQAPADSGVEPQAWELRGEHLDFWEPDRYPDRPRFAFDVGARMSTIGRSPYWRPIVESAETRIGRSLDIAELGALSFFVAVSDRFDAAGDTQAAENLRRYLGGSGETLQIPERFTGTQSKIRRGININIRRLFENTAVAKFKERQDLRDAIINLEDGENFTFTDHWRHDITESRIPADSDEHNALGAGGVNSTYTATATQLGDKIFFEGMVQHGPDPRDQIYDFQETLGAEWVLERVGIAVPFDMVFEEYGMFEAVSQLQEGEQGIELVSISERYWPISRYEYEGFE